jgi:hypothetical protein
VKKFLVLSSALAVFLAGPAQGDNFIDEQYVPTGFSSQLPPGSFGVWFRDDYSLGAGARLVGQHIPSGPDPVTHSVGPDWISLCDSLEDTRCQKANYFDYFTYLPHCISKESNDCIETFFAISTKDNQKIEGIPKTSLPAAQNNNFRGNSSLGIPNANSAEIWELPGVLNASGSNQYAVNVADFGNIIKRNDGSWVHADAFRASGFEATNLSVGVFPVSLKSGAYFPGTYTVFNSTFGPQIGWSGGAAANSCALVDQGACAQRFAFPQGYRFGVVLRLTSPVIGWLAGRLQHQEVTYKAVDTGGNLTLIGDPVTVPQVSVVDAISKYATAPQQLTQFLTSPGFKGFKGTELDSIALLNLILPSVQNISQATVSQWSARTLLPFELGTANQCLANNREFVGFVATNSTTYTGGPPVFDKSTGSLNYSVASAHYLRDGSVFKGTYDLTVRNDVARCLYGFSKAPIKASISVTDSGSTQDVATEVLNQDSDWTHLGAYGFTFSNPTIKVVFSQSAPTPTTTLMPTPTPTTTLMPTPTPTTTLMPTPTPASTLMPTPTPASTPTTTRASTISPKPSSLKTTISCLKGKLVKKVTAVNPSCPMGYKKK